MTTGLLEAVFDKVPLLAITGMKPTAQLGYAEFQDCNQGRLFAGAGIEWSKDAASPEGVIPLLRDGVATALTQRTCAHLAIPVDIQAARSPLPLKQFCAANAMSRIKPAHEDKELVEETAATLVGDPNNVPRNIIAVGLRGCFSEGGEDSGAAIMELAEALNAPVLTRLDAKGVVDECHPLAFGVVGVHGKPGMEIAATLISSSDCVIAIGVDDETLLVCNVAGLQIRKVIEIEPDAFGVTTRFEAEHTLVGPISETCRDLALSVETKTVIRNRKKKLEQVQEKLARIDDSDYEAEFRQIEKFSYMAHNNPRATTYHHRRNSEGVNSISHRRFSSIPNVKALSQDSHKLWDCFLSGNVS